MATYKDELTRAMEYIAVDKKVVFIGYGVRHGGRANGTLKNVDESQLIETPCAENLMVGLAIGMALDGFKPVVFIERFDFITNAIDAIVNHLVKAQRLSKREFNPTILLRVVVGNMTNPLYTGETHTQDFTDAICAMTSDDMSVYPLRTPGSVFKSFIAASNTLPFQSSMLIEYKDYYGMNL